MTLPTPATRLWRSRPTVAGVALLAAVAISIGATASSAQVSLSSSIDADWRGAYDILVRPAGSRLSLETTGGLIEPNFLGFAGHGGITLAQLAAIRAIHRVDLAAPISVVGYLSYLQSTPSICIVPTPSSPTEFEVSYTVSTTDGVTPVVVARDRGRIFVGPDDEKLAHFRDWWSQLGDLGAGYIPGVGVEVDLPLGYLPPIVSPLVAVDPTAERQLLGASGVFLDRFDLLRDRSSLTTANFDQQLLPPGFEFAVGDLSAGSVSRPVVPIVASRHLYAPLTVTLDVQRVGKPLKGYPAFADEAKPHERWTIVEASAGTGRTEVGQTTLDVSDRLRPFLPPNATIVWPGTNPPPKACLGQANYLTPTLTSVLLARRPTYSLATPRAGSHRPTFQIAALGAVTTDGTTAPVGPAPTASPGSSPGTSLLPSVDREAAYREFGAAPLAVAKGFVKQDASDQPFHFGPIGTFDLGDLSGDFNPLSYVPLGAYDPPDTTLIAAPDGTVLSSPKPLTPTLNPRGLIAVPPLAITDLPAATLLRGDHPIDAIRVRVSGIGHYDAAARATVERVASTIVDMGLDVDIVAGSSPQSVEVYVPGYNVERDPPSDLGYVTQEWTTLGAAARVENGVGTTSLALFVLGLFTALVFTVGLQLVAASGRRRDAAILMVMGWTRTEILRWMAVEGLLAGSVVCFVGLAAALAARGSLTSAIGVVGLALLFPLTAILGGVMAILRATPAAADRGDVWTGAPSGAVAQVTGLGTYAIRSAIARPLTSIAIVGALGLGSAALAYGVTVVGDTLDRAGPTLLAQALTDELRPLQLGLLCIVAAGGLFLTVVLLRLDRENRNQEYLVLAAAGWDFATLGRLALIGRLAFAVPAAIIAGSIGWSLAHLLAVGSESVAAGVAVLVAFSVVVWGRSAVARKPTRPSLPR